MAQPNIEIAVINIQGKKLIRQRYIWNPDFAFAWPGLAANPGGESRCRSRTAADLTFPSMPWES